MFLDKLLCKTSTAICLWTQGSSVGGFLQTEEPWNEKHLSFDILLIKNSNTSTNAYDQILNTWRQGRELTDLLLSNGNWSQCNCLKNLAIYNSTRYVSLTITWFQGKEICAYWSTLFFLTSSEKSGIKNSSQPCKMSPASRQRLFHSKHKMDLHFTVVKKSLVFCRAPADTMIS